MDISAANDVDEYEEMTMILELNGVLDGESVRDAVEMGDIQISKSGTANPLVQIGSSLYNGEWTGTVRTDMIFRKLSADEVPLKKLEEEELNQKSKMYAKNNNIAVELVAVQDTRLDSKAVVEAEPKVNVKLEAKTSIKMEQ